MFSKNLGTPKTPILTSDDREIAMQERLRDSKSDRIRHSCQQEALTQRVPIVLLQNPTEWDEVSECSPQHNMENATVYLSSGIPCQ